MTKRKADQKAQTKSRDANESSYFDQWTDSAITSTPAELRRATVTVACNARDGEDAADLLAMLGLVRPCPHCATDLLVYGPDDSPTLTCPGCAAPLRNRWVGLVGRDDEPAA